MTSKYYYGQPLWVDEGNGSAYMATFESYCVMRNKIFIRFCVDGVVSFTAVPLSVVRAVT